MLSIEEMVNKTEATRKDVKYMLDSGHYDYTEHNLVEGLKPATRTAIWETLRGIPLKEFLARSGDDGIAGAVYLIPEKIYQIMFDSAVEADICDKISIAMIPADQIPGTTLNVDIAVDESYKPHKYSSGGAMPTETMETTQATLDFSDSWGINFKIANDLIEDSQFDIIEMHLRNAGREMGEYASNLALGVMKTGSTGADGTLNGGATGDADATAFVGATTTDIVDCYKENCSDGYISDTIVMCHEAFFNSVVITTYISGGSYSEPWAYERIMNALPTKMMGMDIVWSNANTLTNNKAMTNCVTLVFDKDNALLTGRKRWLRIEKYSDPIRDLVGATVTARQDSVTVYNDSIAVLTET